MLGFVVARVGVLFGAAALVAIGLAVFVTSRPINGLIAGVALVLLIPYWYGKGGVTVMQLGVGLAIAGILITTVVRGTSVRWTGVDLVVAGMLLAAGLDWWLRDGNLAAARAIANTVLPLVFYFAARLAGGRAARALLWTLVIAAALASFSLFYEFARGSAVFVSPSTYNWSGGAGQTIFRPGGVFGSPPAAITVLAMAALVGIALWGETAGRRRTLLCGCLALIVAGGLVTFTRAGWIGFAAGLLSFVVLLRWKAGVRLPRVGVAIMAAAGVAILVALPAISQTSVFRLGVTRGGTFAVRESYWSLALPLVGDTPGHLLFGRGLNSMVVGTRPDLGGLDASIADAPDLIADGTHNQYIRTLLEQGVVGLGLSILWLGGVLILAVRRMGSLARDDRRLVAGLAAATLSFLVVSLADNTFRDPNSLAIIALLTGLLVSLCKPPRRRAA